MACDGSCRESPSPLKRLPRIRRQSPAEADVSEATRDGSRTKWLQNPEPRLPRYGVAASGLNTVLHSRRNSSPLARQMKLRLWRLPSCVSATFTA